MRIIRGILAGVLITLGGRVYVSVYSMNDTYGKIIGAILFSIGLLTILIYKLHLFTGKVGYVQFSRKTSILKVLTIWVQNLIGCVITGYALYIISSKEQLIVITSMVETKLSTELLSTFILAIFCGALMFIAVDGYNKTNKFTIPIMCVVVFIISGFEHCIANMGYIVEWGAVQLINGTLTLELLSKIVLHLIVVTLGNSAGAIIIHRITGSVYVEK